jgi:hypothetical protein
LSFREEGKKSFQEERKEDESIFSLKLEEVSPLSVEK